MTAALKGCAGFSFFVILGPTAEMVLRPNRMILIYPTRLLKRRECEKVLGHPSKKGKREEKNKTKSKKKIEMNPLVTKGIHRESRALNQT